MSNETATFCKDPDSVVNYSIDWSDWLDSDTISTSTWAADTGLTVDSDSETTTVATAIVSSGTAGTAYGLTNTITTAAGLTAERTITIMVQESSTDASNAATQPPDTIDSTTNVGKVRLLIGDVSTDPTKRLFSDTEISSFLSMENNEVRLAAATACESLSSQAALTTRLEIIDNYTIDTRKQADAYIKMAERLRSSIDDTPSCGFAEIAYSDFQAAEIQHTKSVRAN